MATIKMKIFLQKTFNTIEILTVVGSCTNYINFLEEIANKDRFAVCGNYILNKDKIIYIERGQDD